MDSLIRNHPFLDGNKRTGIAAAGIFFQMNGYQFHVSNKKLVTFTLEVAESRYTLGEIASWLQNSVSPID